MCPVCMCACTHRYRHRFAFQGSKEWRIKIRQPGAQKYWKKELSLGHVWSLHGSLSFPLITGPKGLLQEAQDLSQL